MEDRAKQFAGAHAVVTGATQQGLGACVARLFARRGMSGLVICGRNAGNGEQLAAELCATGCRTFFVRADLGEVDECRKVVARARKEFGTLHVLVNVAAITERGSILDTDQRLFDRMFAVNTRAPFFLMQDAVKIMREHGIAGTIVNILSIAVHGSMPRLAAYVGSKAALAAMTKNVAFALLRDKIRVNGLNLGWMDTPNEDRVQRRFHGARDGWQKSVAPELPFGRLIDPEEAAEAVAFLSSAESGIMTGSVIDYDQFIPGTFIDPPFSERLRDKY